MIFKSKFFREELDLPYKAIEDNVIDNSRWSIQHEIIFEYNGKYYRTYYSCGATEMQDESPWEYEDNVECDEVERKQVMVEQWVSKEESIWTNLSKS